MHTFLTNKSGAFIFQLLSACTGATCPSAFCGKWWLYSQTNRCNVFSKSSALLKWCVRSTWLNRPLKRSTMSLVCGVLGLLRQCSIPSAWHASTSERPSHSIYSLLCIRRCCSPACLGFVRLHSVTRQGGCSAQCPAVSSRQRCVNGQRVRYIGLPRTAKPVAQAMTGRKATTANQSLVTEGCGLKHVQINV